MTNKIIIAALAVTIIGTGYVAYATYQADKVLRTELELLRSIQLARSVSVEESRKEYDSCVERAYTEYSDDWNRQCWSGSRDTNCLLPLLERYDIEYEFHTDVLSCLAKHK